MEPADETLCRRVAEGNEAAFDMLVGRYQKRAYRLAWSILRDAEAARDVSQDAFVRLYEMAGTFGGQARFSTWFYRILVNLCMDHWRKHRWWRKLFAPAPGAEQGDDAVIERLPAAPDDPVDHVDRERQMTALWAAVNRLAPQQRAAVLLQVQEGLPTREIATVLKCSEATVRVHLHRALTTLRKTLSPR